MIPSSTWGPAHAYRRRVFAQCLHRGASIVWARGRRLRRRSRTNLRRTTRCPSRRTATWKRGAHRVNRYIGTCSRIWWLLAIASYNDSGTQGARVGEVSFSELSMLLLQNSRRLRVLWQVGFASCAERRRPKVLRCGVQELEGSIASLIQFLTQVEKKLTTMSHDMRSASALAQQASSRAFLSVETRVLARRGAALATIARTLQTEG